MCAEWADKNQKILYIFIYLQLHLPSSYLNIMNNSIYFLFFILLKHI